MLIKNVFFRRHTRLAEFLLVIQCLVKFNCYLKFHGARTVFCMVNKDKVTSVDVVINRCRPVPIQYVTMQGKNVENHLVPGRLSKFAGDLQIKENRITAVFCDQSIKRWTKKHWLVDWPRWHNWSVAFTHQTSRRHLLEPCFWWNKFTSLY